MKSCINIPAFLIVFLFTITFYAQTPGINYQAFITNEEDLQVPGSDIPNYKVPLIEEDVNFRFSITNEFGEDLYIEEQVTTTDKNGLISLIIGQGVPAFSNFTNIIWDGTPKFLNVEINIMGNNDNYTLIDSQRILYLPQSLIGKANIQILNSLPTNSTNYNTGDLIWLLNADNNNNPSLYIWDGNIWSPVSNDDDPTNELNLIVTQNDSDRDSKVATPETGDQVWNISCNCIQVFNGNSWISIGEDLIINNGLSEANNVIQLGGNLIKPTVLETTSTNTLAITGIEETNDLENHEVLAIDKNTGVIKKILTNNLIQEKQKLIIANQGQTQFEPPLNTDDIEKINVYRNGVRIDCVKINNTTIQLEPGVICYQGDEIRIVQFY